MEPNVQEALWKLAQMGIDPGVEYIQDYNKIPLENTDLSKVEQEIKKSKVVSKHTIIVDSRSRDYNLYPQPNKYLVELYETHRNVERIELIAAMMPKTEYNVNSENNLLIVTFQGVTKSVYLTEGQYLIGSNKQGTIQYKSDGQPPVFGLIAEVRSALNKSFNTDSFNVFLATVPYTSNGTGSYASVLNRVVITNDSDSFEIDFLNTGFSSGSPFRLLGYQKKKYTSVTTNAIYATSPSEANTGICTSADLESGNINIIPFNSVVSEYDYDLKDDPKYVIMNLEFGVITAQRTESIEISTNQKFACIIYDANDPDNIQTFNNSVNSSEPVSLQTDRRPGNLKALKGSDFDKKVITFTPPITIESLNVSFYKWDNTLYNFNNREHLLVLELDVADYDPTYRY
jgi:hypothetical protein